MPDEPDKTPKSWRERGLDFLFGQTPAVLILIVVSGFFGWFIYTEIPKRDEHWTKAFADQTAEFKKILEERDVRTLAYRTKADDKHAESVKAVLADSEKNYNRLVQLVTALQRQGVVLEKKLDAMQ